MGEKSLPREEFLDFITENGKYKEVEKTFYAKLEEYGYTKEKITFAIMRYERFISVYTDNKLLESVNFTVNLALYDTIGQKQYHELCNRYARKNVCLTKYLLRFKVDYKGEYEDLRRGMSSKEVGDKYNKTPAAVRQDKSRYLKKINSEKSSVT